MPELPEVEWMVAKLHHWCKGATIKQVEILRQNGQYLPDDESTKLPGQVIYRVSRRGKYVIFHLSSGFLVGHNNMSGYWDTEDEPGSFDYVEGNREATDNDVRVRLILEEVIGSRMYGDLDEMGHSESPPETTVRRVALRFHDARLFGSLRFHAGSDPARIAPLASLASDAVTTPHALNSKAIDPAEFYLRITKSKRCIKQILLDQEMIAGVGNIYAAEALWSARINPTRKGKEMTSFETFSLIAALRAVMGEARMFNLDYTKYLKVYRQEFCSNCRGKIARIEQSGRSTYYCPTCQE